MVVSARIMTIAAGLLCAGCALTEPSADRALITSQYGEIQAVATRADRRITFVDENWMWGEDRERENVAYRMTMSSSPTPADQTMFDSYRAYHYCAEPSPDATRDLLSQLAARIGDRNPLAAEYESRSRIEALFRRSQGVQLFRDGLFALCQAHHNGAVGSEDYGGFIDSLIERTSYLVALELALAPAARTDVEGLTGVSEIVRSALSHLAPAGKRPVGRPGMMAASELELPP